MSTEMEIINCRLADLENRLNGIQFQLYRLANALEFANRKKYGYQPEYKPNQRREL